MNHHTSSRPPLEGDFVESTDSLIFDVKGLLHPPERVIAYVRYVADPNGERQRQGQRFRKIYDLDERRIFLTEFHSDYLYFDPVFNREMQGIPRSRILKHYDPQKKVQQMTQCSTLDHLEARSLEMLDLLRSATGLPTVDFGISGSLLVGLQTSASDIDLVVYGGSSGAKVVQALGSIRHKNEQIRSYEGSELRKLRESRLMSGSVAFQDFVWHEQRKALQGVFRESDYFVRCIRKPGEVTERYGDNAYFPLGQAAVKAAVLDDSEAIFTPCRYLIDCVDVIEGPKNISPPQVVSFRGRFCEQAKTGERIFVKGYLERVVGPAGEYFRLVVGEGRNDQFIVRGQWDEKLQRSRLPGDA